MKNIISTLFSIALLVGCLASCSKEEVDVWKDTGRVWFTSSDTLNFTFAQHADVTSYVLQLPISLAGKKASVDRTVNVTVSSPARNSQTKFEIENPVIIPKDSTSGNLNVKVYKTDNLDTANDTISFTIGASPDLEAGLQNYLTKTITLTNHYTKPIWWKLFATYEIGRYTEKKVAIIDLVVGLSNIKGGPYDGKDGTNWVIWLYKLRKYVTDNGPLYDYDGKEIRFASGY